LNDFLDVKKAAGSVSKAMKDIPVLTDLEITEADLEQVLGRKVTEQDVEDAKNVVYFINEGGRGTQAAYMGVWRATTRIEQFIRSIWVFKNIVMQSKAHRVAEMILDSVTDEELKEAPLSHRAQMLKACESVMQTQLKDKEALLNLSINISDPRSRKAQNSLIFEVMTEVLNKNKSVVKELKAVQDVKDGIEEVFEGAVVDVKLDTPE